MYVNRVRFWILAALLFLYVAGVLILSAVTLHEPRITTPYNNINKHQSEHGGQAAVTRLKNFDYGLIPGLRPPLRRSKIQWCAPMKYLNPPRGPVALASFPGSGNTWLRYLLQQATGYYTGSVYKDYGLLKNGFPAENVSNGSVLVVKTHEWGPNARRPFNKAILLVRAPGAAIQAEFNRQSGGHIGFASPDRYKRTKGKFVKVTDWQQFVSSKMEAWKATNLDWLYNFTGPTHVIFYEQLVGDVEGTLRSLVDFLDLPQEAVGLRCALDRKEGIYRRKRRVLNFDPYTEEMRAQLKSAQARVYEAIYNFASYSSAPAQNTLNNDES